MTYTPPWFEKETELQNTRAKFDDALQPFNRSAPRPFPEETNDQYRRRVLPILQSDAPDMKAVKVHNAHGTAFDMIERQTFEAAAREAKNPTLIPDGELREVHRVDQVGRKSIEFFGRPSTWMNDFSVGTKKRVVGIRTETERGYRPGNMR